MTTYYQNIGGQMHRVDDSTEDDNRYVEADDYDAELALWKSNHAFASKMADDLTQDGIKDRARIRELEAALLEAKAQRDSWKRIAESGLGLTAATIDRQGDATTAGANESAHDRGFGGPPPFDKETPAKREPYRLPMTGAYAPEATCKHGVHPFDCNLGCDPNVALNTSDRGAAK